MSTNGNASAQPKPQFQTLVLTLSDGRRGLFSGLAIARPTEIELMNLHITRCDFTEPGDLPPQTSLPALIAALHNLKGAAEAFEDRPTPDRGRMLAAAQETVFDILDGVADASGASDAAATSGNDDSAENIQG